MTARPPRHRLVVALTLTAGAALAAAAACAVPGPDRVAGPNADRAASRQTADSIAAATGTFFEFQVEQPVTQVAGSAPAFPAELRAAGVSGEVIAQYVVGTDGLVDTSTFKVLQASDPAFVLAVKEALPAMRFEPAEVQGRKVRQLVQQPFVFQIAQPLPKVGDDPAIDAPAGTAVMTPLRVEGRVGMPRPVGTTPAPQAGRTSPVPAPGSDPGTTYFEFQVEHPATQIPGTGTPTYPSALQAAGVEGTVIAQFVVNTDGTVDPRTFKALESPHELFTASVRRALADMRFTPAEAGGHRVKQLVQQPFVFAVK